MDHETDELRERRAARASAAADDPDTGAAQAELAMEVFRRAEELERAAGRAMPSDATLGDAPAVLERHGEDPPPDVVLEDKMVRWADAFYDNSMRIAAAGVLRADGSLDKAASVLFWAGFEVPPGYFPDGHPGEDLDRRDEEALQLWVEGERENILRAVNSRGLYLASTGRLMDEVEG